MPDRVWLITGASRGLGRQWAIAALERGERVAVSARHVDSFDDLIDIYGSRVYPLALDVTDREDCFGAVRATHDHFGRIDVVVNNAGYGQYGFIEEISEDEARAQLDTNFFGALWVTQAALPFLRAQGSGHLIQVSSIGGVCAFPYLGAYHASKWALEGMTQSLSQEVTGFGIHVTLIEPAGFATDWVDRVQRAEPLPAYDAERDRFEQARTQRNLRPGDPVAAGAAILEIVDALEPPRRVFFGEQALDWAEAEYASRLNHWRAWQPLAERAHG